MNCMKIEKLLPLYAGGDLGEKETEGVRAHLSSCDFCRSLSEEFAASQERLRNFPLPEFGAEFYAELRGAVMKEISESPSPTARPSIFRPLFTLFAQRPALATSLATLALFGLISFALYLSLVKNQTALTAIERSMAESSPAVLPENGPVSDKVKSSNAEVRPPMTIAGNIVRRRPRPERAVAARPQSAAPESIDNVANGVTQPSTTAREEAPAQAVARMDIQTSDPNIRIIWLARKTSE